MFRGGLLAVDEVICRAPRGGCDAAERNELPEVVLPSRGVFTLHRRGTQITVDSTTAFVLNGEYRVSHPCDGGDRCVVLRFAPGLHEEALGDVWLVPAPRRLAIGVGLDQLQTEEEVMWILAQLAQAPPLRRSPRIERVRELLAANPAARWKLADIARAVHISPYHLARQFRATTGQTIWCYLTGLRLAAALDRLRGGEDNLARLAAELGFASHSHLTERFHQIYGATPSEVRKILTAKGGGTA